jgi:hypothetical protein
MTLHLAPLLLQVRVLDSTLQIFPNSLPTTFLTFVHSALQIMTTTNPPAVKTLTFCNTYTSGYQYSSASAPTGSSSPPTTSQAAMQAAILEELKDATFTVNLTAQGAPLQADPDDVQKVFGYLRDNCRLTHMTLFADDKLTKGVPRLPPSGFGAVRESYEPLTHLLNTIVHAANSCLTGPRYLEALHFYPHGVEMREKIYSDTELKPDMLGLLHSHAPDEPTISWNNVAVFIEVKSKLIEAVKRLATYAYCHLAVERRRSFTIAIAICRKKLALHFICFHRSGISVSPPLHLDNEDGFQSVVEHIVGIVSIRDEEAFGLDVTRVENVYRLNHRDYEIVRTIHERNHIRYSAAVYSLKRTVLIFFDSYRLDQCRAFSTDLSPRCPSWPTIPEPDMR